MDGKPTAIVEKVKKPAPVSAAEQGYRLLHSEHVPVVFDYFSDRVYSRGLSFALFSMVFLFVLRAGLWFLFEDQAVVPERITQPNMATQALGANGVEIGTSLVPVASVQLLASDTRRPLPGRTVRLGFHVDMAEADDWGFRYGYSGTLYDYTGLPIDHRFSLPGFLPAALRTPVVTGAIERTDANGFARFRKLKLQLGVPGTYAVTAVSGKRAQEATSIVFSSKVADVKPVSVPLSPSSPPLKLGDVLPPMTVRVVDAGGNGIPGKRVVLLSAPPSADEYSSFASSPDLTLPRFALFESGLSELSDDKGLAVFRRVRLNATSLKRVEAFFICDGAISSEMPLRFRVEDPYTLSIVRQPAASVREGVALGTQPVVRVTRNGLPVAGVRVMAFPGMRAGFFSPTLTDPSWTAELNLLAGSRESVLGSLGRVKHSTYFLSSPSNSTGLVTWDRLGFLRHGPAGQYTLVFACVGIDASLQSRVIDVTTSVARVRYYSPRIITEKYPITLPGASSTAGGSSTAGSTQSGASLAVRSASSRTSGRVVRHLSAIHAPDQVAHSAMYVEAGEEGEGEAGEWVLTAHAHAAATGHKAHFAGKPVGPPPSVPVSPVEEESHAIARAVRRLASEFGFEEMVQDDIPMGVPLQELQEGVAAFFQQTSDEDARLDEEGLPPEALLDDEDVGMGGGGDGEEPPLTEDQLLAALESGEASFPGDEEPQLTPEELAELAALLGLSDEVSESEGEGAGDAYYGGGAGEESAYNGTGGTSEEDFFNNTEGGERRLLGLISRAGSKAGHGGRQRLLSALSSHPQEAGGVGRALARAYRTARRRLATARSAPGRIVGNLSTTICNFPTCRFAPASGGAYGNYQYSVSSSFRNGTTMNLPPGPSGYFSRPPSLLITDVLGRPLAGKTAQPVIRWRVANGTVQAPTANVRYILQEFPGTGAGVSRLSMPTQVFARGRSISTSSRTEGVLPFYPSNTRAYPGADNATARALDSIGALPAPDMVEQARYDYGLETGDWGSYLRLVVAPQASRVPAGTQVLLTFDVEGREVSDYQRLHINHMDADQPNRPAARSCAFLEVTATPRSFTQNAASESLMFSTGGPFDGHFTVRALNSFGDPVQADRVSMQVVDGLGLATYYGVADFSTNPNMQSLSPDYINYLKLAGGGLGLVMSNYTASVLGSLWLHPPSAMNNTDAQGIAQFNRWKLGYAQRTYATFAFTAVDYDAFYSPAYFGGLKGGGFDPLDVGIQLIPPPSACLSAYTPPVPILSVVNSVEWDNASAVGTCTLQSASPASAQPIRMPQPIIKDVSGRTLDGSQVSTILITAINEALTDYPAYHALPALRASSFPDSIIEVYAPAYDVAVPSTFLNRYAVGAVNDLVISAGFVNTVPSAFGTLSGVFNTRATASNPWAAEGSVAALAHPARAGAAVSLPQIGPRPGAPGAYTGVAFAYGVQSEPLPPIDCKDDINQLVVQDWTGAAGSPPDCPADLLVYPGIYDIGADRSTPVEHAGVTARARRLDLTCGGVLNQCNAATGKGACVCGVCVCKAGWDGAADCSVPFAGDSFGTVFSNDPQYSAQYGGIAVLDQRMLLERASTVQYYQAGADYADLFPSFLLAKRVVAGRLNDAAGMLNFAVKVARSARDSQGIPPSVRAGDVINGLISAALPSPLTDSVTSAISAGLLPGVTFTNAKGKHGVMPVLVTCRGEEARNHYFTAASPVCAEDRVSVAAQALENGVSSFDFLSTKVRTDDESSASTAADATKHRIIGMEDQRLLLHGLPSGCYRFKYVYAPRGSGSLAQRSVFDPLATAQASTVGYGRPFRVLSPVTAIQPTQMQSFTLVRDAIIDTPELMPSVTIRVRRRQGGAATDVFKDTCGDTVVAGRPARCPSNPSSDFSGLHVYVSAVRADSGAEYPLYRAGQQFDCARAYTVEVTETSVTGASSTSVEYKAVFRSLAFPSLPDMPPDRVGDAPGTLLPGVYRLKFTSHGVSALSPYTITVVDGAQYLFGGIRDFLSQGGVMASAIVGVTNVLPAINVSALVRSTANASEVPTCTGLALPTTTRAVRGADAELNEAVQVGFSSSAPLFLKYGVFYTGRMAPVPRLPIRAQLVYGPTESNAVLSTVGLRLNTDRDGAATFDRVRFEEGVSGVYYLAITAAGYDGFMLAAVNVTNPIASVQLQGHPASTPRTPLRYVLSVAQRPSFRVCPRDVRGRASFANTTIKVVTYVEPPVVNLTCTRTAVECRRQRAARAERNGKFSPPGKIQLDPCASDEVKRHVADAAAVGLTDERIGLDAGVEVEQVGGRPRTVVERMFTGDEVTLTTGPDGCAEVNRIMFRRVKKSTRLRLVFRARGVDSQPMYINLLTVSDANPVTPKGLQERVIIPMLLAAPAFGANSLWFSRPMRFVWVIASVATVIALWFLGTGQFLDDLRDMRVVFTSVTTDNVSALNIMYTICISIATAMIVGNTLVLFITLGWHRLSVARTQCLALCGRGKNKKGPLRADDSSSSSAAGTPVALTVTNPLDLFDKGRADAADRALKQAIAPEFSVESAEHLKLALNDSADGVGHTGIGSGYYGHKLQCQLDFARGNMVHMCDALVMCDGSVAAPVFDALEEVCERYAALGTIKSITVPADVSGTELAAQQSAACIHSSYDLADLPALTRLIANRCSRKKAPEAMVMPTVVKGVGAAALEQFFLTTHLGQLPAGTNVHTPLTEDAFISILTYRLNSGYAGSLCSELCLLTGVKLSRAMFTRDAPMVKDKLGTLRFSEAALPVLRQAYTTLTAKHGHVYSDMQYRDAPWGCLTYGGLLDYIAPGVTDLLTALGKGPLSNADAQYELSLHHFLVLYHARLTAAAADAALHTSATGERGGRSAIRDQAVWAELRAWGYDSSLNLKPMTVVKEDDNGLRQMKFVPRVESALHLAFQRARAWATMVNPRTAAYALDMQADNVPAELDWECMNEFHRICGFPDMTVAQFRFAAAQSALADPSIDADLVNVQGYAAFVSRRFGEGPMGEALAHAHCWALLTKCGYSRRIKYVGDKIAATMAWDKGETLAKGKLIKEYTAWVKKAGGAGVALGLAAGVSGTAAQTAATAWRANPLHLLEHPCGWLKPMLQSQPSPHMRSLARLASLGKVRLSVFAPHPDARLAFFYPQRFMTAMIIAWIATIFLAMYFLVQTDWLVDDLDMNIGLVRTNAVNAVRQVTTATLSAIDKAQAQVAAATDWALTALTGAANAAQDIQAQLATQNQRLQQAITAASAGVAGGAEQINEVLTSFDAATVVGGADAVNSVAGSVSGLSSAAVAQLNGLPAALTAAVFSAMGVASQNDLAFMPTLQNALNTSLSQATSVLQVRIPSGLPTAFQAVITGEMTAEQAANVLVDTVGGVIISNLDSVRNALVRRIWGISIAVTVICLAFTWSSLFLSTRAYRFMMLEARKGRYPVGYVKRTRKAAGAPAFIGVQLALVIVAYAALYSLLAAVFFALSWEPVYEWLWEIGVRLIPIILTITLLIKVIETILMKFVLTFKDVIVFPRWYSIADLYFTFINIFVGLILGLMRFILAIVIQILSFMRTDSTGLASRGFDLATNAFDNLLMTDVQYNHPIKAAATYLFVERMMYMRNNYHEDPCLHDAEAKAAYQKKCRIRNRWLLALLLARVPSLQAYRVRDAALKPAQPLSFIQKMKRKYVIQHNLAHPIPAAGTAPKSRGPLSSAPPHNAQVEPSLVVVQPRAGSASAGVAPAPGAGAL